MISSVFLGYIISPSIAGLTLKRTGPKYPVAISLMVMGALSAFTAQFASWGWEYVLASRLIQGFVAGFCFPCLHTILSRWTHPDERSQLASIAISGAVIGSFVMAATSGFVASTRLGWPAIFYLSGGFGIIWSCVLLVFCHSTPNDDSNITPAELKFIESMPGYESVKQQVPFKDILTAKAYWGLQIAQIGESWSYASLMSVIPSYTYGILRADVVTVRNNKYEDFLSNIKTIYTLAELALLKSGVSNCAIKYFTAYQWGWKQHILTKIELKQLSRKYGICVDT